MYTGHEMSIVQFEKDCPFVQTDKSEGDNESPWTEWSIRPDRSDS